MLSQHLLTADRNRSGSCSRISLPSRMSAALPFLQKSLSIEHAIQLDHLCDQTGPAGLMVRTQPSAVVSMEILIELEIIPPVCIGLELLGSSVDGPLALCVPQKNARQAIGNLLADFE